MNIPELLPYFDTWKRTGNGKFSASCPMPDHDDSDPSVSVSQDAITGKILMFCWGCGRKAPELIRALGLSDRDLFGDPGHPAAIIMAAGFDANSVPKEELDKLEDYLAQTYEMLELASEYVDTRFGLSITTAKFLRLGVDPGDDTIIRPEGYEQFAGNASHLIIPFLDPLGNPVGMQGRRLEPGDPRWRSKGGTGWSKIGCFGWELQDPVIITEGPSDALAVVGMAQLPALAIRGASLTADYVCEQIKDWLDGRIALVIGDNGEPGQKFSQDISERVGIPSWKLPDEYSDLAEYLGDGGNLDKAILGASHPNAPKSIDTRPSKEIVDTLYNKISGFDNLREAQHNDDLTAEIKALTLKEHKDLFALLEENARSLTPRGSTIGSTRTRIIDFRQETSPTPPRRGGNGNGNNDPHQPRPVGTGPEILWNPEDQLHITEASVKNAMDLYDDGDYYQASPGQYVKVIGEDLVNLKESGVKSMLSQMGHWRVLNGARELGHVPTEASRMVSDPSWDCEIDIIKRRVEVPFMLEDGNIISTPGFHEESGIFLLPRPNDRIIVPNVPTKVTDKDIEDAKKIFADVIEGFIFDDEASKANLIAMTLTPP